MESNSTGAVLCRSLESLSTASARRILADLFGPLFVRGREGLGLLATCVVLVWWN